MKCWAPLIFKAEGALLSHTPNHLTGMHLEVLSERGQGLFISGDAISIFDEMKRTSQRAINATRAACFSGGYSSNLGRLTPMLGLVISERDEFQLTRFGK